MSKFVYEIIEDIKSNPSTWKRKGQDGLKKDNIIIDHCGNGHILFLGWITSIVHVKIDGIPIEGIGHLSWWDKILLEEAFKWWIRNVSLKDMYV